MVPLEYPTDNLEIPIPSQREMRMSSMSFMVIDLLKSTIIQIFLNRSNHNISNYQTVLHNPKHSIKQKKHMQKGQKVFR